MRQYLLVDVILAIVWTHHNGVQGLPVQEVCVMHVVFTMLNFSGLHALLNYGGLQPKLWKKKLW
jgi:hypothetical protein